ncbi:MAG TPA: NADH-quinone oxidoreductase subunit J, partial [Puia sp.]|nr:NADH-quinone oxidoreductase subunit J [Puia sp.]
MSASAVIFYILSFFILATGLLAVTSRKIFRSAIWLLFSLTGIAGLYFWLQMEFIAAVQIVVYVGGIVVLIIFSIFLTQQSGRDLPAPVRSRAIFSVLAVCIGFVLTCLLVRGYAFGGAAVAGNGSIARTGQTVARGGPIARTGQTAAGTGQAVARAVLPGGAGGAGVDASVGNIGAQMLSTSEHGYVLPF